MNIQVGQEAVLHSKEQLISGTYLHNAWYVATWSQDVAPGKLVGLTILKEPVVIYRLADGKVAALEGGRRPRAPCPPPPPPRGGGGVPGGAKRSSAPITGWNTTRRAPARTI